MWLALWKQTRPPELVCVQTVCPPPSANTLPLFPEVDMNGALCQGYSSAERIFVFGFLTAATC